MTLRDRLLAAIDARSALLARLQAEGTDCVRLLHGVAEGAPGVSVDRYGGCLLAQTFRAPLAASDVDALQRAANDGLGLDLPIAGNHRGAPPPPDFAAHAPTDAARAEHVARERGLRFRFRARHRGQDPWLVLDFRSGRAFVQECAAGKRVLNLFAYTCGVGVAAAAGGAARALNVDFAPSALEVGAANAAANGLADRCAFLRADCLPVLRQLAGLPVQRRGKNLPYARVEREPFDLVVLDPPRLAKTPFGTIDVVRDYQSLFKPALLALADGGAVLATNHVPTVDEAAWHDVLRRCAEKAGRPLRSLDRVPIDADFPSFDGKPPLKLAVARI
ncbi:MAG: class I SAM-dependent methyltransferase [Planctomycetota bacterium]